ncbi:MAG: 2-succinylbenzoate--CoA ligase [Stenomitos rutilans HA7619-LM2]|jgi:O-succinylbenzoic acid--CoA ligase|nr:2-succinylbenzoate--CoA ligase [Stenomitos rutilans HA7619-LM2]
MQRKTALTDLKQRSEDDWLIGYNSQEFFVLAERVLEELRSHPQPATALTILLAERDPLTFLAHFIAACAANCCIVLANPDWVPAEWDQVFELVQPDLIRGEVAKAEGRRRREAGKAGEAGKVTQNSLATRRKALLKTSPTEMLRVSGMPKAAHNSKLRTPYTLHSTPHILIPTGGTSGNIRFAIHTWETLMASVGGFCQYFEVKRVNSFCVLPLYHVSGLMQFLRSFTTGGQLVVLPFKAVERGDRSSINPEDFFLSLVPTQLQRLLNQEGAKEQTAKTQRTDEASSTQRFFPTFDSRFPILNASIAWLSRFHTVFLGGAPAWSDLLEQARHHHIRLAPTYGMTETASQIATLKPDDFLKGHTNAGQVLPHAQITIRDPDGNILAPHQIGNITIQAKSLAWKYYPGSPGDRDRLIATLTPSPTHMLFPRQISCSGGLGELGPQKAGSRGEVPRTQSLDEAEIFAHYHPQREEKEFQPDDLGFFDSNGYLHIIGRYSDKMITGGENVFPAEVEAAIRSTGLVQDICVIGVSDRHWGQAITAVHVPLHASSTIAALQAALEDKLSKFKHPKYWVAVAQLPRNAQGKVNRLEVEAIANAHASTVPTID